MVTNVSTAGAAFAVAALVVGAAVTGCGSDNSPSPSSSSSSSASSSAASSSTAPSGTATGQPGDYTGLLIPATDIVVPGDTFVQTQSLPIATPAGVEGVFNNQANTRKVEISIYVYNNPDEANQALDTTSKSIQELSVKAPTTPAEVGIRGVMAIGPSPDGTKAKGVVIFTEGKALGLIEAEGAPDDPVDQGFLLDVARKQDAKMKAGLPG